MDSTSIGGLNYEINLGGNLEQKISEMESRIKAIKANVGVGSKVQDAQAQKYLSALSAQVQVLKRVLTLTQQQTLAQNALLNLGKINLATMEAQTIAVKKQYDAEVGLAGLNNKKLAGEKAVAVAKIANVKLAEKELAIAQQVAQFRAINAKIASASAVAKGTGLHVNQVTRADAELAQQAAIEEQLVEARKAANIPLIEGERRMAAMRREAERMNETYDRIKANSIANRISMEKSAQQMGISAGIARRLGIEMKGVHSTVTNLLFTFRRLVGVLAIFTLARKFAQYIGAMVGEMSRFNAELESARISFVP